MVAIQTSSLIVPFETVAFRFDIFSKCKWSKKRTQVLIKISKSIFVDLTCFVYPRLASQPVLTCSKSTIKTIGHVVKSVQSKQ